LRSSKAIKARLACAQGLSDLERIPFSKKKERKGAPFKIGQRRARPISSGPPFPNPKIGKRGPFKIGQARQLPPFLMTSKFKHSTVQICQGPQYSKESQSVEQQKTAIKIKKDKNYYEPNKVS